MKPIFLLLFLFCFISTKAQFGDKKLVHYKCEICGLDIAQWEEIKRTNYFSSDSIFLDYDPFSIEKYNNAISYRYTSPTIMLCEHCCDIFQKYLNGSMNKVWDNFIKKTKYEERKRADSIAVIQKNEELQKLKSQLKEIQEKIERLK